MHLQECNWVWKKKIKQLIKWLCRRRRVYSPITSTLSHKKWVHMTLIYIPMFLWWSRSWMGRLLWFSFNSWAGISQRYLPTVHSQAIQSMPPVTRPEVPPGMWSTCKNSSSQKASRRVSARSPECCPFTWKTTLNVFFRDFWFNFHVLVTHVNHIERKLLVWFKYTSQYAYDQYILVCDWDAFVKHFGVQWRC